MVSGLMSTEMGVLLSCGIMLDRADHPVYEADMRGTCTQRVGVLLCGWINAQICWMWLRVKIIVVCGQVGYCCK